jgi:regulatory protein
VSTLTEIAVPRRGSRRRTLVLDGEPWRDAPSDVVSEAHLKPGDEFDAVELSGRLAEIEPLCARDRAVRLLTYRDRSTGELADRLAEDGYLPETVTAVIERLTSVGLLDDERFARSFARSLTLVRHLGRSRASRELAARGIDPLLAAEALDEAFPVEAEQSAAAEFARSLTARPGATRDKVAARLARRGYSPRVALSAARDATSEIDSACEAGEWNDSGPDDEEDGRDGL